MANPNEAAKNESGPTNQRLTFTLVTQNEPIVKRTFLMRILGGYPNDHPIFNAKLAIPEKTIFECFQTAIKSAYKRDDIPENERHEVKVRQLSSAGESMEDQVYPDMPSLLYSNRRIQKSNILVFLKKVTTVNDKFRKLAERQNEEKIKRLEVLCQTQLHLVTVSATNPFLQTRSDREGESSCHNDD